MLLGFLDLQKLFHGCVKDSAELVAQRDRYVGILIAQISDMPIRNAQRFRQRLLLPVLFQHLPSQYSVAQLDHVLTSANSIGEAYFA